ncbi:MAG: hypothetical protein WCJ54_07625, partial [Actinomycetota bacterium]
MPEAKKYDPLVEASRITDPKNPDYGRTRIDSAEGADISQTAATYEDNGTASSSAYTQAVFEKKMTQIDETLGDPRYFDNEGQRVARNSARTFEADVEAIKTPGEALTTPASVIALMKGSKNDVEWNVNCDKVKAANNGDYPDFWFKEIIINK